MAEGVGVEYATMRDACEITGRSCSAVERWLTAGVYGLGPLENLHVGHVRLIKRADLEQYAAQVAEVEDGRTTRHKQGKG